MSEHGRRSLKQREMHVHILSAQQHLAAALKIAEEWGDHGADFPLWVRLADALNALRRAVRQMKRARS